MNVLVYSGPEVVHTSLNAALSTLRSILVPNYSVQIITQQALSSQPWSSSCALLVFPECRRSYQSTSTSVIQTFVENGGAYLGLSTGASISLLGSFHVSAMPSFGSVDIIPERPLRFHVKGRNAFIEPAISGTFTEGITRLSGLQPSNGDRTQLAEATRHRFVGVEESRNCRVLAKYVEDENTDNVAGLMSEIGSGRVVLWSPGLEYSLTEEPATALCSTLGLSLAEVSSLEEKRRQIMKNTLSRLGLQLPSTQLPITSPLPQFLIGHPMKGEIVSRTLESLEISPSQRELFKDNNDTLQFHSARESTAVIDSCRNTYLCQDPSSWQPKHIIFCVNGELPPRDMTPLFDTNLYFQALSTARAKEGLVDVEPWGMGDAVLYGEVVTSTQTMLDKNPRLLSQLSAPFVSLGTYQLAGRGRGANVWLSPSGCLQFSLLLRVSLATLPAQKLVFVQYLFALAVCEACRDGTVLGIHGSQVKIKWPNDIYASTDDTGTQKKIGGILVNTSFSAGKVDIVIGCGLNVLNVPPMLSLTQLLPSSIGNKPSIEFTVAVILAKFEAMWSVFIESRGSFDSFMDLYLSRWLHSDQLVTITTTNPHQRVRIVGITSDHGLLRTLPERSGWSPGFGGFIDLQPDGNSFDLMAGMIKAKS